MSVKPVAWTPGPWAIGETYLDDAGQPEVCIYATLPTFPGERVYPAAVCLQFPNARDMQQANARLIASAPELAEALQRISNAYWDGELSGDMVRDVDKLLARITPK